jgi:hypothetical protein
MSLGKKNFSYISHHTHQSFQTTAVKSFYKMKPQAILRLCYSTARFNPTTAATLYQVKFFDYF